MASHVDPSVERLVSLLQGSFVLVLAVFVVVWLLTAVLACAVAPDDRPWSFFWCTLLLLGPLGVAVAVASQPRPPEGRQGREGLQPGEYFTD